jgi:hypothetical protein
LDGLKMLFKKKTPTWALLIQTSNTS